jgi:hypothetical protein
MAGARFLSFHQTNLIPGSPADEGVIDGGMQMFTERSRSWLVEVLHLAPISSFCEGFSRNS